MKKPKLVTRESLRDLVAKDAARVVARALIVIYERQTSEEQSQAVTKVRNGVGFSGADAEIGTRCAKAALSGKLEPWMLKIWSSVTRTGFPKICKYARQLNEIAEMKKSEQRIMKHYAVVQEPLQSAPGLTYSTVREVGIPCNAETLKASGALDFLQAQHDEDVSFAPY